MAGDLSGYSSVGSNKVQMDDNINITTYRWMKVWLVHTSANILIHISRIFVLII